MGASQSTSDNVTVVSLQPGARCGVGPWGKRTAASSGPASPVLLVRRAALPADGSQPTASPDATDHCLPVLAARREAPSSRRPRTRRELRVPGSAAAPKRELGRCLRLRAPLAASEAEATPCSCPTCEQWRRGRALPSKQRGLGSTDPRLFAPPPAARRLAGLPRPSLLRTRRARPMLSRKLAAMRPLSRVIWQRQRQQHTSWPRRNTPRQALPRRCARPWPQGSPLSGRCLASASASGSWHATATSASRPRRRARRCRCCHCGARLTLNTWSAALTQRSSAICTPTGDERMYPACFPPDRQRQNA